MRVRRARSRELLRRIRAAVLGAINLVLRRLGLHLVRTGMGVGPRRIRASMRVFEALGGTVQEGPFSGTRLSTEFLWGDANAGSIVLGCYEQQLHPALEELIARRPEVVVNIGCAEGTYAVGLARRLPDARVIAVDVDPRAEAAVTANAALNGVEARVSFLLADGPTQLRHVLDGIEHAAVISDCEGCELDVLRIDEVPHLERCDLLIESHDFVHRGTSEALGTRFAATHDVETVTETGRNPHRYDVLRPMPSVDKWLVVGEGREETMTWLWCRTRSWTGLVRS